MKTARKGIARRIRRAPPLSLSARVERLEKTLLFPAPSRAAQKILQPFTNLAADGTPTEAGHVAVLQAATGLIWTAAPLAGGKGFGHANAIKVAADLDLLGSKGWRLPTIQELLSIVDYGRFDPAVDPQHFKGPYSWTWSSTVAAGPSGFAWGVLLDDGYSSRYGQSIEFHVLAVRAGQQFGLGI